MTTKFFKNHQKLFTTKPFKVQQNKYLKCPGFILDLEWYDQNIILTFAIAISSLCCSLLMQYPHQIYFFLHISPRDEFQSKYEGVYSPIVRANSPNFHIFSIRKFPARNARGLCARRWHHDLSSFVLTPRDFRARKIKIFTSFSVKNIDYELNNGVINHEKLASNTFCREKIHFYEVKVVSGWKNFSSSARLSHSVEGWVPARGGLSSRWVRESDLDFFHRKFTIIFRWSWTIYLFIFGSEIDKILMINLQVLANTKKLIFLWKKSLR